MLRLRTDNGRNLRSLRWLAVAILLALAPQALSAQPNQPSCDLDVILSFAEDLVERPIDGQEKARWQGIAATTGGRRTLPTLMDVDKSERLYDLSFYRDILRSLSSRANDHVSECPNSWLQVFFGLSQEAEPAAPNARCESLRFELRCIYSFLATAYWLLDDSDLAESDRLARETVLLRYSLLSELPASQLAAAYPFLKSRFGNFLAIVTTRQEIEKGHQTHPGAARSVGGIGELDLRVWTVSVESLLDSTFLLAIKFPDLAGDLKSWIDPIFAGVQNISGNRSYVHFLADRFEWVLELDPENLTGSGYIYASARYVDRLLFYARDPLAIQRLRHNHDQILHLLLTGVKFLKARRSAWIGFKYYSDHLYQLFLQTEDQGVDIGDRIWLLGQSASLLLQGIRFSLADADLDTLRNAREQLFQRAVPLVRALWMRKRYQDLACFSEAVFRDPQVLTEADQLQFHAFMATYDYRLGRTRQATEHLEKSGGLISFKKLSQFKDQVKFTFRPCEEKEWQP